MVEQCHTSRRGRDHRWWSGSGPPPRGNGSPPPWRRTVSSVPTAGQSRGHPAAGRPSDAERPGAGEASGAVGAARSAPPGAGAVGSLSPCGVSR
ncbi:hypothetical protein FrCorBMG51_18320 [Protofrankia coriariae]|uniref:Uncharacterized protein n=1 Tax=Protofrankia coriariae TaxID=1562887 RepID=A0ABR5F110_9ACTN|nr:hypothetical protein FrCorBMG51_18320 [Protofrankia coriariae]